MKPKSHFSLGMPVTGDEFFGRSKELSHILSRLQTGSAINFYGLRRMGKSSLLKQIHFLSKNNTDWQQFQPVYLSVQGIHDVDDFAVELAERLMEHEEVPDKKRAWKLIENHKNITDKTILLLDEVDNLIHGGLQRDLSVLRSMQQEGIFNIVASTLYESMYERLRRQNNSEASLFNNFFYTFRLPVFAPEEAENLLITLCQRGGVKLDPDLAKELAWYVGYYPNFVQELGHIAFCHLVENKAISFDQITKQWRNESGFQWIDMILSPFDKYKGTTAELIGVEEEDYLIQSLETYGVFLRDKAGNLVIAPYVSDILMSYETEQSFEGLRSLAAKDTARRKTETNNQNSQNHIPQPIHIEKGEVIMGDKFVAGNNVGGIQNIGKFDHVFSTLNSGGHKEVADALLELKQAIMASQHLSNEKKEEHIEVINTIGTEVAKPQPNKTMIKMLGDGLMEALKIVPDVVKAAVALAPIIASLAK